MKTIHRSKEEPRRVDWSKADDRAVVQGVLNRSNPTLSDAAWRELFARYGHKIDERIQHWVIGTSRLLLSTEFTDEVRLSFYLALLDDNMRRLEQYDPSKMSLGSWLSRLASRVASAHFERRLHQTPTDVLDLDEPELCSLKEAERQLLAEGQEGARWIARGK